MIRIIVIILAVLIFFATGAVTVPVIYFVKKKDSHKGDLMSLHAVQKAFKVALFLAGTKITFVGLENIPTDKPIMYIGNHRSIFDIVITYTKCPDLTGYIAKKEIKKVPFLRYWMKRLYCLFLDRHDMRAGMKVILEAIDMVKRGISVFVFPEGTRNKDAKKEQELLPFKDGTFKIALKTGCPVLPVAITGTMDIFEGHFPFVRKKSVVVRYGEPIYISSLTDEQKASVGEYFRGVIIGMLDENEELLTDIVRKK